MMLLSGPMDGKEVALPLGYPYEVSECDDPLSLFGDYAKAKANKSVRTSCYWRSGPTTMMHEDELFDRTQLAHVMQVFEHFCVGRSIECNLLVWEAQAMYFGRQQLFL